MKPLLDTGFDTAYNPERIDEFYNLFPSEKSILDFVNRIHREDNTIDMKRGEFYPELLRAILGIKKLVAKIYNIGEDQCQPNFGSNGSIDTILTAMKFREMNYGIDTKKKGGMLVSTPTYFRNYNSCNAKQLKMIKVPLKNWNLNLDYFLKNIVDKEPTVVFLVSPNNPTGIPIRDEDIISILESVSNKTLVVIDRTLINTDPEISTKELLAKFKHKQLAILHSFSKYLGLSHLRIGFALYSNMDVAREIQPHLPLGIGLEGAIKATKIMMESNELRPSSILIDNILQNKRIISDFCTLYTDFSFTNFTANYCILILPKSISSKKVMYHLEKNGIFTMDGSDFPEPLDGILRLHTGGQPEYMQKTMDSLKEIYLTVE